MWLFVLFFFLPGGELVLTNGKTIAYQGEYEVVGQMVKFKRADGSLVQLPSKLVDFDKTAKRQKALAAKAEREAMTKMAARNNAPDKTPKKQFALADMIDDDGASVDREVSIGNEDVDGYVSDETKYARHRNRAQTDRRWRRSVPNNETDKDYARQQLAAYYKALKARESNYYKLLNKERQELSRLNRSLPIDSDNDYDNDARERGHQNDIAARERNIANIESQIKAIKGELKKLSKVANELGIYNYR